MGKCACKGRKKKSSGFAALIRKVKGGRKKKGKSMKGKSKGKGPKMIRKNGKSISQGFLNRLTMLS